MQVQKNARGKSARRPILLGALIVCGCGNNPGAPGDNSPRPTLNLSTLGLSSDSTYFETYDNNLFEQAELVEVGSDPRVIRGRIGDGNDVDVYDLGPMSPETRVLVEMTAADTLDAAISLFDEWGSTYLVNDHRNVYLGQSVPFIDVVVARDTEACYVAIAATPGFSGYGDYALQASVEYPVPLPGPRPDTVLLVFDGGRNVRIGNRPVVDVPAFDAANISEEFQGDTDEMMRLIVEGVREDYEGYDVVILSTSEGARYESSMTRLFFGTYDPALLGIAEGIDEFNGTQSQEAIVFTDTFAAFMQLGPTIEEMAQAIANVASHEAGHLFGLVHTKDPHGIMDVTASLNQLLVDQHFRRSPIYVDVFPVGAHDAIQLLFDTLGGDEAVLLQKQSEAETAFQKRSVEATGPPARQRFHLSTCGLEHPRE